MENVERYGEREEPELMGIAKKKLREIETIALKRKIETQHTGDLWVAILKYIYRL